MAWLLIDNSNTRTKFALGDAAGLHDWRGILTTKEVSSDRLRQLTEDLDFTGVMIGSVVPEKGRILREFFASSHPVHSLGWQSPLGISIDYPQPAQIGADRLANAVGVYERHGAPAIVIDFGTAVTFDIVSGEPAYCGGVIAPGLGAMSGYLNEKTALLPKIELEEPASAIGKSTVMAMQAGAIFGYRGLVKGILGEIRRELIGEPKIVATGGDAALISKGVPEIETVDLDLTLDGLRHVASRVFG